jgi:hypothetical protein
VPLNLSEKVIVAFAVGSSFGRCHSRRAGNSVGDAVHIRPVAGKSILSELPRERVLHRHVCFDDGQGGSVKLRRVSQQFHRTQHVLHRTCEAAVTCPSRRPHCGLLRMRAWKAGRSKAPTSCLKAPRAAAKRAGVKLASWLSDGF